MVVEAEASRVAQNAIERTASVQALIRDSVATIVLDEWFIELKSNSNYGLWSRMKNEKEEVLVEVNQSEG